MGLPAWPSQFATMIATLLLSLAIAGLSSAHALPSGVATIPKGVVSLILVADPELVVRHCSFQLFACHEHTDPPEDFLFTVVPALNGDASGISLQSVNYPDHYIAVVSDPLIEVGRLGISDSADVNDASFAVVPGLANASFYSLRTLSTNPKFKGSYVAINSKISGMCAAYYSAPTSDVVLLPTPPAAAATWNIFQPPPPPPQNHTLLLRADTISHEINRMYMGCHR